jgi:hypothetical protein
MQIFMMLELFHLIVQIRICSKIKTLSYPLGTTLPFGYSGVPTAATQVLANQVRKSYALDKNVAAAGRVAQ